MTVQCKKCGFAFEVEQVGYRYQICPRCKAVNQTGNISRTPTSLTPPKPLPSKAQTQMDPVSNQKGIPWEIASEGYLKAFFMTLKKLFLEPLNFFENLSPLGGFPKPIFFAMICYFIIALFVILSTKRFLSSLAPSLIVLLIFPILYLAHLYFNSFVIHCFLRLFKGAQYSYEATFRIFAYSQATLFVQIIPYIGRWIGFVVTFVFLIIGLNKVQKATAGQIAGVLVSTAAILFAIILIIVLLFAGFFALLMGIKGGKI
jgi:phage FluMu protein Com